MPCPTCGATAACPACLAAKEPIRRAARAGLPVLRIRGPQRHIALHGNSAAFCGKRELPLPGISCGIWTIPGECCSECVEIINLEFKGDAMIQLRGER